MFENVNYDFYSDTLGRAVVPDVATFNKYKMLNIQYMKRLLPYVEEYETNGIDSAVCMMIEVDYCADLRETTNAPVASETTSGHSVSFDMTGKNKDVELNARSTAQKKLDAVKLFCSLYTGV